MVVVLVFGGVLDVSLESEIHTFSSVHKEHNNKYTKLKKKLSAAFQYSQLNVLFETVITLTFFPALAFIQRSNLKQTL